MSSFHDQGEEEEEGDDDEGCFYVKLGNAAVFSLAFVLLMVTRNSIFSVSLVV